MEDQIGNSENYAVDQYEEVEAYPLLTPDRFVFLSVISFGLYELWWYYKAWKYYQYTEEYSIQPAMRAVFAIFFLIPLFNKIKNTANESEYDVKYNSILLFIGSIGTALCSYLPMPYAILSAFSFVFVLPAFKAFNFVVEHAPGKTFAYQHSYNGRQKAIIAVGSFLWLSVLLGLFLGS